MYGWTAEGDPGGEPEYERALLVARLDELACEIREIHRQARSLEDRVAGIAEGCDTVSPRPSGTRTRSTT